MRGRHRAPRTSEETRQRRRLRVRRGASILVVTLLATIPVGVSAAMVPGAVVSTASSNSTASLNSAASNSAASNSRSLVERVADFGAADSLHGEAVKAGGTPVPGTAADAALSSTAIGVGVKAASADASCGADLGAASALAPPSVCAVTEPTGLNWSVFDPGNIIPDAVFYNTAAMDDVQIREFIRQQGAGCVGEFCLRNLRITTSDQPADQYCTAYAGGVNEDAAAVLGKVSRACGVNPQVMLVTLQKESGLLSRTDPTASTYDAAWGWHCPDTGPGGSANCDPAYAGFFNQAFGMAKQWSRYRVDPGNYNYRAGQTVNILWNVVESGCGSAPVTIKNTATASLYNYTPYQPNAAALASYPGTGDACSAYGNRNFFFLFGKYFGGATAGSASFAAVAASMTTQVTIPNNQFVDPALAGQVLTAPTASVAAGLAAGFAALGLPYVWGGGGSGAGPDNGCPRGGGALNSCGSEIGFDCSGLTAFVLGRAGFAIPGDSSSQRAVGTRIGWDQALPGDVVGFPGHVAIYLGAVGGVRYILEASTVGTPVHIVKLTRGDADPQVYRFWAGIPQIGAGGSTFIPASPWSTGSATGGAYLPTIRRYFPVAPVPSPAPAVLQASAPVESGSGSATQSAAPASAGTSASTETAPSTATGTSAHTGSSGSASSSGSPGSAPSSGSQTSGSQATTTSHATAPSTTTSHTSAPSTTTTSHTSAPSTTTASTTTASTTTTSTATETTKTAASTTAASTTAASTADTSATTAPANTSLTDTPSAPSSTVAAPTVPAAPQTTSSVPAASVPAASVPAATVPVVSCPDPAAPTTVSMPTAPSTPPLLPAAATLSIAPNGSTLFMTAAAMATAAMTAITNPVDTGADASCH